MTITDKFAVYGPGNKTNELTLKKTFIGQEAVTEWLNYLNCKKRWFVLIKPTDNFLWPTSLCFIKEEIILYGDEKNCDLVSAEKFVKERQECVAV